MTGAVRGRARLTLLVLAIGSVLAPVRPAAAAVDRMLVGLDLSEQSDAFEIRVRFGAPVRYLRHAPASRGSLVEIELQPLAGGWTDAQAREDGETLRPPPNPALPLRDVRFEREGAAAGRLVVSFWQNMDFRVRQERDHYSLVIRVSKQAAPEARPPSGRAADPQVLLEEAKRALIAGEPQRAIPLYTVVLSLPEGEYSREAREYLGVAHQRAGQIAHARAEYETYLEQYPDSEGAERVRQRLEALRSARRDPRDKLRSASRSAPAQWDAYGSVATSYERAETFADITGGALQDSSQVFDVDAAARMRRGQLDGRARVSGYYRYDFIDGASLDGSRVRELSVELRHQALELGGIVGRQPARGGGVLGRFDGGTVGWRFRDRWRLTGVGGLPQDSSVANSIDTHRAFFGLGLGADRLWDHMDAEVYAIGQRIDGQTDRVGLGAQLRWFQDLGSLFTAVDYDVHFASLNLAMLSGSLNLTGATTLNLLLDHRRSPFLTTRNALVGQPVGQIEDLARTLSNEEIEALAKDRTPKASTLMFGATHQLDSRWQVSGDFTAATLGGTPASGGVTAWDGTGWELFYDAQLVGSSLVLDGDIGRLRLRVFDGHSYTGYGLALSWRVPVPGGLRVTPSLYADYRNQPEARDQLALRPGLRLEYRLRSWTFDADTRFEWLSLMGGGLAPSREDDLGYILHVEIRYDF